MGTTGKSAWEKYYKYAGDEIETFVKKDAELYDISNQSKVIASLTQGQTVKVPLAKDYEVKPIVIYKAGNKEYKGRVKFDVLQKPGIKSKTDPSNIATIGNKVLTPDGLGLGGKTILKTNYIKVVNTAVDACKLIAPHIKDFLKMFAEKSSATNSAFAKLSKDISSKDLAIIAKDFGEIAGAWWFLNNYDKDIVSIEFPARSNEPLVDYYGVYNSGLKIGVSAKAGGGAAPSIVSVWRMIGTKTFSDITHKKIHNFIGGIVNFSGTEGIVRAAKAMGSPLYKTVGDIIGKSNYTADDIETWTKEFATPEQAHDVITKTFYDKIGKSAKLKTYIEIWQENKKRNGIILSPMAYALVDEVNSNKKNTDFLTDIVRTNNIEQLYVYLTATGVKYQLKGFKDSNFVFEYHSNAKAPGGNKIGFWLKK